MKQRYLVFVAMIATATVVMYALMYVNVDSIEHVFFSQTRVYMALVMGATMALVMLAFMLDMYESRRSNAVVAASAVGILAIGIWLIRSQATVEDVPWMKAMIPHHSIAVLTSERARITDPRVRDLAARIVRSQRDEIEEMKVLIAELERRPASSGR